MESRKVELDVNNIKLETIETEEIRKEFKQINDLIRSSLPLTNK